MGDSILTPSGPAAFDSEKPTVLLILSTVRGPDDTPEWTRLRTKFNFLVYDCPTIADFCERLKPGGAYSNISAILRTGWLKAGPYAHHKMFRGDPIQFYPPSLRLITCSGHGYDAADVPALTAKGIAYANTPDCCTEAVANTALHLILNSYRYFGLAEHVTRAGRWEDSRALGTISRDPIGQTLGVLGMGDIGLAAARKAAWALGMRVAYHNRRPRPDADLAGFPNSGRDVRFINSVDELFDVSDCILLACPLVPETANVLNRERFARLRPRKQLRVVNIARGGLIDEDALLEAMDEGKVVGVGLDVHANEPGVNERLKEDYKTTLLPHIGVCSDTTWASFDRVNLENLEEFFYGDRQKVTLVNRKELGLE